MAPVLELQAAIFDDGSHEGDVRAVAEIAARRIGSEIQHQRTVPLVEAILADAQSEDAAKVERIRSYVAQLAETPDTEEVERVRSQFPTLSGQAVELARRWLGFGLNGEKQWLERGLKEFQQSRAGPRSQTLAQWWSIQRTR